MRVPNKSFVRAWYEWLRLNVPTHNFHLNRSKAPTYGIQLALDHSRSYVHSLGSSVIGGEQYDFVKLASDELEKLNKIGLDLEMCVADETQREELRNYIDPTQSLLEEIEIANP